MGWEGACHCVYILPLQNIHPIIHSTSKMSYCIYGKWGLHSKWTAFVFELIEIWLSISKLPSHKMLPVNSSVLHPCTLTQTGYIIFFHILNCIQKLSCFNLCYLIFQVRFHISFACMVIIRVPFYLIIWLFKTDLWELFGHIVIDPLYSFLPVCHLLFTFVYSHSEKLSFHSFLWNFSTRSKCLYSVSVLHLGLQLFYHFHHIS